MILNTDSNDGDDHNCFKIIIVSSIVLVLHLSGVISVKRLSSLSQLYHSRTRHTYMSDTFLRINNVYLSSLKISISKLNAMHLSQLSHPRHSLHSGWHISKGDQCKINSTSRVEHNLVWFSDPLFKSQMGTMLNMTTILVPHIKSRWWRTSVASAGPSSASMRETKATKAHQLRYQHQGKPLF